MGSKFEFWEEKNGYLDEDDANGNEVLTMMDGSNVNENILKRKSDIDFLAFI